MTEFHNGFEITLESGDIVIVKGDCFKKGGQGCIYHASLNGSPVILKWYHSRSVINNEKFRSNLKRLTTLDKINGFVMPEKLTAREHGSFGYIMEQIPDDQNTVQLSNVIFEKDVDFKAMRARVETPALIASCFATLHENNLIFKDINDSNIFVNLRTPKIHICDCDNISEPGSPSSVKGKIGFMAPELRRSGVVPDELSDRYSLAVTLYMLIMRDKPFEGKALTGLDRDAIDEKNKETPIFTLDPNNSTNRPENDCTIDIWNSLPDYVQEQFVQTFTIGLQIREKRTSANKWFEILNKWASEYNPSKVVTNDIKCKRRYQPIFFIVDSSRSMLTNSRMEKVNEALNKYIHDATQFRDTEIALNILQFSECACWYYKELVSIDEIGSESSVNLLVGNQYTHLSEALWELDAELKKENVLHDSKHPNRPLILLMSDGYAKRTEYEDQLKSIRHNYWFGKAYKYAIAIETNDMGKRMLQDFTGDPELVSIFPSVDGEKELSDFIKNITMTLTQSITQTGDDIDNMIDKLKGRI